MGTGCERARSTSSIGFMYSWNTGTRACSSTMAVTDCHAVADARSTLLLGRLASKPALFRPLASSDAKGLTPLATLRILTFAQFLRRLAAPPRMARISPTHLDEILSLQLAVAWAGEAAGEPARLGWWKSDLVDGEGGGDLFARLVPRTAKWASHHKNSSSL